MTNDELAAKIDEKFAGVDGKFAGIDGKFGGIHEKLAGIDETLARVGEKLARVDERLAGVDEKLAGVGEKFGKIDGRFEALNQKMDEGFKDSKMRDEELRGLMTFGLEAREVLRDEMHRRFDASDRKHDEQITLLKDAVTYLSSHKQP